mgnify:CR=1 FL=1
MGESYLRIALSVVLLVASAAARAQFPPPAFPGQMRPAGDPAVVDRGHQLYDIHCRACHGADLRGGDMGGPNLLRSPLTLNDQAGESIGPVVRNGRTPEGGGRSSGRLAISEMGLYRVTDGTRTALAAAGPLNPIEFADVRSTPEKLGPIAAASAINGSTIALAYMRAR